jgi:hypothetical protein
MSVITIDNVTTVELNGVGSFDRITEAFTKRLEEQWSESRIRGTEYATVYLGLMSNAMQQAIAFELGKQEASAQADLIVAQRSKVIVEADLIVAQKDKVIAETGLLTKEGLKIDAEIALLNLQVTALNKEIIKTNSEIALIDKNAANATLQGLLLVEERLKIIAETARINVEKLGIVQGTANAVITATNLIRQQEKSEAETELLKTKKFTEQAQYLDVVNGADVTGIIGKQKSLYTAQTNGFARDAEQKLAKIVSDSWAARRATDEATIPPTSLDDTGINKVMNKAVSGIGA